MTKGSSQGLYRFLQHNRAYAPAVNMCVHKQEAVKVIEKERRSVTDNREVGYIHESITIATKVDLNGGSDK